MPHTKLMAVDRGEDINIDVYMYILVYLYICAYIFVVFLKGHAPKVNNGYFCLVGLFWLFFFVLFPVFPDFSTH